MSGRVRGDEKGVPDVDELGVQVSAADDARQITTLVVEEAL